MSGDNPLLPLFAFMLPHTDRHGTSLRFAKNAWFNFLDQLDDETLTKIIFWNFM